MQEFVVVANREFMENVNVTWNENGTVSYTPKRTIVYVPEMSVGHPEVDIVRVPNIPMLVSIARYFKIENKAYNWLINWR